MTVIKSRPGLEATVLRFKADGRMDLSKEYSLNALKSKKMYLYSSFNAFKCGERECFGIRVLVNDEFVGASAEKGDESDDEGPLNGSFNLACVVYIKGVKQAQFKLHWKAMPGSVASKSYEIKRKRHKSSKVGPDMIPPEEGIPMADVQLQLYRYEMKGGKPQIKKEKDRNGQNGQHQATTNNHGRRGGRQDSRPGGHRGVYMKYLDPKNEPYAVFRWMYLLIGNPTPLGGVKLVPRSGVLLPRTTAHIDLTTTCEPTKHAEAIDLTLADTDDEDDDITDEQIDTRATKRARTEDRPMEKSTMSARTLCPPSYHHKQRKEATRTDEHNEGAQQVQSPSSANRSTSLSDSPTAPDLNVGDVEKALQGHHSRLQTALRLRLPPDAQLGTYGRCHSVPIEPMNDIRIATCRSVRSTSPDFPMEGTVSGTVGNDGRDAVLQSGCSTDSQSTSAQSTRGGVEKHRRKVSVGHLGFARLDQRFADDDPLILTQTVPVVETPAMAPQDQQAQHGQNMEHEDCLQHSLEHEAKPVMMSVNGNNT